MVTSLDNFLFRLGNPGRFQMVVFLLLACNYVPVAINHLIMTFYGITPPHNCQVPEGLNRNLTLPKDEYLSRLASKLSSEEVTRFEECRMYISPYNHSWGKKPCIYGYEFHVDGAEWTVVSEWSLVCDRKYIPKLITTLYFAGVMVGGVVFGHLADRVGRQPMVLTCLYAQCAIGIALHFVASLHLFIGMKVLQGFFVQGLQCVSYSLAIEIFSPKYRTFAGVIMEIFWATGLVLLGFAAYFIQHWRYIQLAISLPTLVTILYIWLVPESLRWLISKGRLNEATKLAKRTALYNNVKLNAPIEEELHQIWSGLNISQNGNDKYDMRDLVRTPKLRKNCVIMFYLWLAVSLTYYGISFHIPDFSGDRHFNFIIGGALELVAYMISFLVMTKFGRRVPLCLYFFLAGCLCISTVAVTRFVRSPSINVGLLSTSLALLGKAAIVSCFCILFIYTSEIFPTVLRAMGLGTCTFWARLGSMVAPQVLLLGEFSYRPLPLMVFGSTALLASLLTLVLPETYHKPLSDTIEEAENAKRPFRTSAHQHLAHLQESSKNGPGTLRILSVVDGDRPESSAAASIKEDIYHGGRSSTESDELHFDEDSPPTVKSILKKTDVTRYSLRSLKSDHDLGRLCLRSSKHSIRSDMPRSTSSPNNRANRSVSPAAHAAAVHQDMLDRSDWQRHETRRSFADPRVQHSGSSSRRMKPSASTSRLVEHVVGNGAKSTIRSVCLPTANIGRPTIPDTLMTTETNFIFGRRASYKVQTPENYMQRAPPGNHEDLGKKRLNKPGFSPMGGDPVGAPSSDSSGIIATTNSESCDSERWQDEPVESFQAFDSLEDPVARNPNQTRDDDLDDDDGPPGNYWDNSGISERMRDDSEISQRVIFYDAGETKL